MRKILKAKVTVSFTSSDFCGADESEAEWLDRSRRSHKPGLKRERRLTLCSLRDNCLRSQLKRELVEAAFAPGDQVLVVLDPDAHCEICGLARGVGCAHHERVCETQSEPLQFHELSVGDHFIMFPADGDDSGHGGFRGTRWLCRKTRPSELGEPYGVVTNLVCINNGAESRATPGMRVIKVGM